MNIIFHYPFPMPAEKNSGSKKRLVELSQAFQKSSHHVEIISGFAGERKRSIEWIKKQIKQGRRFDLLYSESATIPSIYAKNNLRNPLLDYRFFQFCKKHNINIGLYYRDIHWRFPQLVPNISVMRRTSSIPFYFFDWLIYLFTVDHLFLPSVSMKSELPSTWPDNRLSSLFPGCNITKINSSEKKKSKQPLKILYVGGVTPPLYNLAPLFEVIDRTEEVKAIVCCRKSEWQRSKMLYDIEDNNKITVIHKSGDELIEVYQSADVFSLLLQENPYLSFAMPVKIFEAVGSALPMITFTGTEMAGFIQKNDIGWVVENVYDALYLVRQIKEKTEMVEKKKQNLIKIQDQHTWQARVDQIVNTMTRIR